MSSGGTGRADAGRFLEVLASRAPLHRDGEGEPADYALGTAALRLILDGGLPPGRSVETGAGASTIAFALAGYEHLCICPDAKLIEWIADAGAALGAPMDRVEFLPERSEDALPRFVGRRWDAVLIDGRHGFPAPAIDWFYAGRGLRVGGGLLLDDIGLAAVRVVYEFLHAEPEWSFQGVLDGRTALFRKAGEGSDSKEWTDQRFPAGEPRRRAKASAGWFGRLLQTNL